KPDAFGCDLDCIQCRVDVGCRVSRGRLRTQPRLATRHDREADGADIDTLPQKLAAEFDRLLLIADEDRSDRVIVAEDTQSQRPQTAAQTLGILGETSNERIVL